MAKEWIIEAGKIDSNDVNLNNVAIYYSIRQVKGGGYSIQSK